MAKDEEYSKDSNDAEAILAYYRVDKLFQTLLPAVGSSSNELTSTSTTISCRLPFLLFSSFFIQFHQVWGLGESKKPNATFTPLCLQPYTWQLMDNRALLPSRSEWRNYKMAVRIRCILEIMWLNTGDQVIKYRRASPVLGLEGYSLPTPFGSQTLSSGWGEKGERKEGPGE